jgi:hypothetical protein
MADAVTIIASLAGGSATGAGVAYWQAAGLSRTTRRGRARFLHEDLYRLQATITRLYYETASESKWGKQAWLLSALASKDDQQDVVAHLEGEKFTRCAGALGWAEYIRSGYGKDAAPSDDELVAIYRCFDLGREAVADLARLKYKAHIPERIVTPAARIRNQAATLTVSRP